MPYSVPPGGWFSILGLPACVYFDKSHKFDACLSTGYIWSKLVTSCTIENVLLGNLLVTVQYFCATYGRKPECICVFTNAVIQRLLHQ